MGSDENKDITGYDSEWGLESLFSRANYIFDDKYIFEVNARWDGSSRFTGSNVYAFFPSAPYAFNNQVVEGFLETDMANTELTWETTTQTNIGFDSEFLNQKFTFSFDWYRKRTEGILLELPIPGVIGLNPPQQNAGIVENKVG